MPLDREKLKKIYSTLQEGGYTQDYATFEKGFCGNENYANRKKVYDLLAENGAQIGSTYEDFMGKMQTKPAQQAGGQPSTRPTQSHGWKPSPMQQMAISRQLQQMQADTKDMIDSSKERLDNMVEYARSSQSFGLQPVKSKMVLNPRTKKLEQSYFTPTGERTTSKTAAEMTSRQYRKALADADMSVGAQIRRVEAELAELRQDLNESSSRVHEEWADDYKKNKAPLAAVLSAGTYVPRQMGDKENSALRVAIRQKEEQLRRLRDERDRQIGKDVGFWRGFGQTVSDGRTWDFGMGDMMDAMTMMDVKVYSSPNATDGEKRAGQKMMKAVHDNEQAEQMYGDNASFWNRAGVMTGYMPSFMVDFAITGGGYEALDFAGKAATRGAVKLIGKEAVKEMSELGVKAYAKKYGVSGIGRMAGNWTIKALGTTADDLLIRAPLMTNTVQAGKTAADIIGRKLGDVVIDENGNYDFSNDKTWGSAIWQGEANAIIENYSEMFGTHLDGAAPALAKTFGGKRISGMLARANASSYGQILNTTRKQFQRLGVSDYFGEVSEEYYGQLWRTMLNLDDAYRQNPDGSRTNLFFDGQFHGDIWGGMALSMGLMGAGKYTLSGAAYGNMKHQVNKADRQAAQIFTPNRWEPIREIIDNTTNEDMGELAERMINDTGLSDEECAAVMGYMERSLNLRGLNLGAMAKSRGEGADENEQAFNEAYIDGYEAQTTQEMTDAHNMYNVQRRRIEGLFEADDIAELESNPIVALREMANNGQYTQEEIDTARDYVNAKTVIDGMKQRVSNDIDEQIAQSDAEITARINKTTGMIIPAVLNGVTDRPVYIVNGNVVLNEDGTIDREASDNTLIVRDAQTGEVEFTDQKQIVSIGDAIDPQEERATAVDNIRQQAERSADDAMNGILTMNTGDVVTIKDSTGIHPVTIVGHAIDEYGQQTDDIIVQFENGTQYNIEAATLQKLADDANLERVNQFEQERQSTRQEQRMENALPNFALYDEFTIIGPNGEAIQGTITGELNEDGLIEVTTDEPISGNMVNQFTPEEFMGIVDTYNGNVIEQSTKEEASVAVPKAAETVPNSTETPQNPTENVVSNAKSVLNPASTVGNVQETPTPTAEPTPLQRIPRDENGEPIFEQADSPETAWDALVEFSEGDAATAKEIADTMAEEKRKAFEKAQKQKPKGKTPTEFLASKKANSAELAKAESAYLHWQKMANVEQNRQNAIRAQQEADDRQRAAERTEVEKAEREAREEAARLEREALEGIPEWHRDTPENARKRGTRRYGGQMFTRQDPVPNVPGKEVEVKFSQKDLPKGRVAVIEAEQLQPSHIQGQRNPMFFIEEAQPKNRAEGVSRMAAQQMAEAIRPQEITGSATAYTGAPTVNNRGEVIQGNNRSDALRYLWQNNLPEQQQAYKQYLFDNAEQLGLDAEAVGGMQHPVLVNMLDVDDAEAIRLGQMTAQDTESGGIERIKPKNVAQKLGDGMRTFANHLLSSGDEEATFGQLVDRNGTEVLKWMNQAGAISNTQFQSAFDSKGNLTAEAKNDLQKVLYQAVFKGGSQQLEEIFDRLPAKAQRAILSTAFRDMDSPFAGKMLPEIQSSVIAYNELMQDPAFESAKNLEEALKAVEMFKRQISLDDRFEQYMPADNFSNFALHLAAMYKASDMSQATIASCFNQMYDLAQGKKAATLFEEADTTQYTLAEIIKQVLGIDYKPAKNGNNNVTDGSADVALRNQNGQGGKPRGNEPPSNGEQTPTGTEPSERGAGTSDDSSAGGGQGDIRPVEERRESEKAEVDENGNYFVKADNGTTIFGEITEDTGLPSAPIKLSEGAVDKDGNGYGLLHIEARHGEQIRKAGFASVEGFVQYVANNYDKDNIKVGKKRVNGSGTFIIQIEDEHSNLLYIELSRDGSYWNVNSGGVFRKGYAEKKKNVEPASELPTSDTASSDKSFVQTDFGNGSKSADTHSDNQRISESKDNNSSPNEQFLDKENAMQHADVEGGQTLQASIDAAASEVNTEPTPAQAEAGNYKKGHITIGEFDITIENPAGSVRKGVDTDGKEWSTTMANTYGYIKGTEGVDGDHIDVFLHSDMDQWDGRKAFVVDQTGTDGSFDEHKVMLGFNDKDEAMSAYLANYDADWAQTHPGLRISETNIEDFNKWVESSHRKTKPFADYSTVSKVTDDAPATKSAPVVEGEGYKVEPKPYTNKQGKTLDTYLVTFDRDFSKEELSAIHSKVKALKGWYDRETCGWMLRCSDDAKAFAEEIIGKSEDEVADEAPLSMADMEQPTEAPVKKVDVPGVFDALKTKGEAKLSDHAKPAGQPKPKKRKWISDEDAAEFDSLRDNLRNHFGKSGDMVQEEAAGYGKPQPKQMDAEVLRMGTRMTYLMMKGGLRSFSDYCEAMKDELPDIFDDMRPHLKSLYAAAQNMEEVMQLGWDEEMDDRKTVKAFDVYNFDKPVAKDIIATAQHTVDEQASQQQTEQIIQTLKDQRNEQRKKEADETSADTQAIASQAEVTASKIESELEKAGTRRETERLALAVDKEVEKVNGQLALLGYYEAEEVEKDYNEAYGYMRNAERKAVHDAHRLATQLATDLGLTIDPKDKVKKSKYGFGSKIAHSNVAPAGGEVYIDLPISEGKKLTLWIGLEVADKQEGEAHGRLIYDNDLYVNGIMFRVENTTGKEERYLMSNNYAGPAVTYDELLAQIRRSVRHFLPEETVQPATQLAPEPGEDFVQMAARVVQESDSKPAQVEPEQSIGGLFGGLSDNQGNPIDEYGNLRIEDVKSIADITDEDFNKPTRTVRLPKLPGRVEHVLSTNGKAVIIKKNIFERNRQRHDELTPEMSRMILNEALYSPTLYGKNKPLSRPNNWIVINVADKKGNNKLVVLEVNDHKDNVEIVHWHEVDKRGLEKIKRQAEREDGQLLILPSDVSEEAGALSGPTFDKPSAGKDNDKSLNTKANEKINLQPRTEEAGRGGQQPRPNEPLGESATHEDERTDGGGMAERGGEHTVSDTERGGSVSQLYQGERGVEGIRKEELGLRNGGRKRPTPGTNENLGRNEVSGVKNGRNNHAERGVDYAPKGEKARIDANLAAIELAKKLLASGATATPKEMEVLRRYSGWGGLGAAFNEGQAWAPNPINKRLRELLTPEEYEAAVMSRNSAYYTPAPVIDAMWDIAKALGFKGGNIMEGSAGIGNIIGLMPSDISKCSDIHAVEIDGTTGGILSLLYPDANVEIQGFEKTRIGNGTVDLAITNVPFVPGLHVIDESGDSDLSKKFRDIHDFCIAKNVRKLREGGIGIFITTKSSLDSSQKLRNWIVGDKEGNSDVVGVFRMNNQTFGGTAATSDIIVIRKRVNGRKSANAIDVSTVSVARTASYEDDKGKTKDLPMLINRYFTQHPENMGGEMYFGFEQGDTYRPTSIGLFPTRTADQAGRMNAWVQRMADMDWETKAVRKPAEQTSHINEALGEGVREGSMVTDSDGNLCVARMGRAVPLEINKNKIKGRTKEECFKDYSEIKDALAEVLKYQTEHEDDKGLQPLLVRLNSAYDTFVERYGHLNKNKNIAWLRNDVDFPGIVALETYSEKGSKDGQKIKAYGKSDIFSRRVVEKESEPTPKNVKDGIIASIYKFGRIDPEYLATQLGKSDVDVKKEIIDSGLGFENPTTGQMEVSYEYLSGNVREKLRQAREANEAAGGGYEANIKALEAVVPMNIPAHLIEFTLGSSWVEPELYEKYIKERTGLDVKLTNAGGTWNMKEPWYTDEPKNKEMGVRSEKLDIFIPGHKLIEAAITNKTITVSKTVKDNDGTHTETDTAATTACATKVDEIRQDFKDWAREQMQSDPDLSMRMEEVYNEQFNNSVPKSIPDEFVPEHFGGAATMVGGKPFHLRPHQAKAVIRATTQPVLLAHEVGTGKTYTLITTAMEMRRLGTARKPMIVVQNATVGQFVASAKALYPNAKVLTLEDTDRNAEGRRAFYAKIKFNDWDMIVVPQSVFERIPDSIERQTQFIQDKIEEKLLVLEQMKEADPDGKSMIVRSAEREINNLRDEIAQLANGGTTDKKKEKDAKKAAVTRQNAEVKAREMLDRVTDDVEDFDSMGIDAVLVDEAHEYKHLGFATAMQRGVKGVDPSYSKKSQGVFLKVQSVLEKTGGKNVVFATGTPISNTAAEIWTFMRYLMPADVMKDYGIYYFDDFVRNFGNLQQMMEFKTNGKFGEVNRFAGYVNLPELVRIWSTVADTVLTREAGGVSDNIPQMEGGKATDLFMPQTRALRSVMKYVKEQLDAYDKMSGKEKKENSHIPLVMYGIAKAAAVDARLVQRDADDDTNSKCNEAVRQTLRTLEETKDYKGTVAIFADNYQRKNHETDKVEFNLFEDIRKKLIDAGVPSEQIVVMKSGMTVNKKLDIFSRVNSGEVRVIMGSTFTLGTGVNIQERLHTLIHLDAPNRPMDYTQRNGRILRQGNLHNEWELPVRVLRFGVEDSLDVTAYQRLKTKGAIADSIMNGKQLMENSMDNRSLEEEQDLFGDITAQLSGSEYALLKNQIEKEVRKLTAKLKNWEADQIYIHNRKRQIAGQNREVEQRIEANKTYLEKVEAATIGDITVGKLSFPSIDAMEDFFTEQNKKKAELQEKVRKDGYYSRPITSDIVISVGGFDFHVHTEISRETKSQQGSLFYTAPAQMTYSCPELGIEAMPVKENKVKNAVTEIMNDVVSGEDFRGHIEAAERYIERNNAELQSISARDGVPFKDAEALAKAEEKLAEYEELMKQEMEANEAKYAEMDKDVEAAANIELTEEDSDEVASEPVARYSEENSNFASRYETKDGKTIGYTSENPEAYGVSEAKDGTAHSGPREADIQRQGDNLLAGRNSGLNHEDGEFSLVERVFTENGSFNFTSGEKIESADDVAFIFSALEDAAKEHAFVVYVKDGRPTVVELGMGTFTETMVDIPTASLAYNRIRPNQVYFVHNHPSGNLKCSLQDVQMLQKIEGMCDVPVSGVIINLKTGKYGTFDTSNNTGVGNKRTPENENRLTVHTLDKQIFAPDYDPMAQPLVRMSRDVAQFLNSQRMGDRAKVSFLILSRAGRIVGNIHTPFTEISSNPKEVARYISERVIQFGGESAILYGDFPMSSSNGKDYKRLKDLLAQVGGNTLLDVVRVEGNHTRSANDEGLLYEPGSEYGATYETGNTKRERIEKLRRSKPVVITDEDIPSDVDMTDRKSVQKSLLGNIRGEYVNEDTGEAIQVLRQGIEEVSHHGMTDAAHVKSLFAIPRMLRKAIYIDEQKNIKGKRVFDSYRYYVCGLKINGEDYTAKIVAGVKDGQRYYDHRLTQIEKGAAIEKAESFRMTAASNNAPESDSKVMTLERILQMNDTGNDNGGPNPDAEIRFREVEDDAILTEFAEGKTVKAYRTMQVIDGKLYSPMATKVGGKSTPEIKLGVPEQSEEHPEIIKGTKIGRDGIEQGYVVIDKGLGKGTLTVAYNPYAHTSRTVLNDQFSSAYIRPNLVTVEVEVPESELTSGYRAPMAKDAVGEISWHSGSVSGQLAELGQPRRVILTRYDRPVRIVPFREVAEMIAAQLDGTDIAIPYNVVQPQLRSELERLGVSISEEATGTVSEASDFGKAEYITDQEIGRINARQQEMAYTSAEAKSRHAEKLSKKFGSPIRIIKDANELTSNNADNEARMRRSKGFYDPASGEVVVVLPNNTNVEDVAETVFHEVVAHKGLREMIGDENYDAFCDEVYEHLKDDLKKQVDEETTRRFMREPGKNYQHHRRVAVDEMFGRMAEKGFEDFTKAERGIWAKLKAKVLEAINKFLGSLKLPKWVKIGDNELRYMLWRSHEKLRSKGDYVDMARDAAKRKELGLTRNDAVRERSENIENVNRQFNEELQKQIDGILQDGHIYQLGKPGKILCSTGVPNLPIQMSATRLHAKATEYGHNFDLAEIQNLVKELQSPIAVFAYGNKGKMQNIIVGIKSNGKQFVVGLSLNPIVNGKALEINSIRNVFPKNNSEWLNWISQGKLLYADKEKIQALIDKQRTILADVDYLDLEYVAKIVKSFENPTIREEENLEYRFRDGETGDIRKDMSRPGDFSPRDQVFARCEYERMVSSGSYQFQEAVQDSMLGLKKLYQAILGKGTRIENVSGFENAYLFENRMSSMNAGEQHEYFQRYMQPLLKEIAQIAGADKHKRRELTDYIMAKHGLERNEYMRNEAAANGKKTDRDFAGLMGLTGKADWQSAEATAQKWVDDYESTVDTTALWQAINDATKATLEKIYLSGIISKETYEKILGMYQFYIPLRGWDETTSEQVYGYLTSKDGPLGGSIMKKAEGRESMADDPIATIGMMADDAIRQGNRNLMKQRFLNFILNHPSDAVSVHDIWIEYDDVTDEWRPVFANVEATDTADEVAQKVEAFEQRMEALRNAEPDKYKKGREAQHIPYKVVRGNLCEHQILIKRNGRTFVATINGNPRAAQALNGLTNPDVDQNGVVGNMLKAATWINRQLSAFYTTRNPDFVVSNFFRDALYSNGMTWVKESPRYARHFHKNFWRVNPVVMRRLLGKWESGKLDMNNRIEALFYQFMKNGGETGYTNVINIEGHKRAVAAELKKQESIGRRAWTALGMQLDLLNRSAENCARFAAFITSREFGRNIDRAIYDAKEISVNFNKKGSGGKMVNANGQTVLGKAGSYLGGFGRLMYVFWNAGIQGFTNFGRQTKLHPAKFTAGATALFALGYVIPMLAQMSGGGDGDDDDKNAYYNLPEYIRRSNICFRAGEQWITIPLPIEYRAMYGMGELAHGVISGNERYTNAELGRQMAAQISQIMPLDMLEGGGGISPFIPSAAKPFTEAYIMNKSWTGLPIYKDTPFNKNDPEWTKAYASTDKHLVDFAKWLNEISGGDDFKKGSIDINPAKIEYLLNGTFGGMFSLPNNIKKTGETMFGDRDFEWRNIPIANRLIKSGDERTENRKLQNEYFKYKEEYEETGRLWRKYQKADKNGVLGYAERVSFIENSPEFLRYEIFDYFKAGIDASQKSLEQEADKHKREKIEAETNALKRELVNSLHDPAAFFLQLYEAGQLDDEYIEYLKKNHGIKLERQKQVKR